MAAHVPHPPEALAVLAPLRALLGAERARDDRGARTAYAVDATPLHHAAPDVVVFPRTTAEVAGVLRLAHAHRTPVTPRGAGTNLSAATVPHHGGIVLVLTEMDRVRRMDPERGLLAAEPGVTVATVQAAAAEHGLSYPPDPAWGRIATIGGNVATCAGGVQGLKHGVTRDHVAGLEVVLADGEVLRCGIGPDGRRADAGAHDLTDLLCGSEGTLAVITEVVLRLSPKPAAAGVGLARFPSLDAAGRAVDAVLRAGVLPSTLDLLDRTCLDAVAAHTGLAGPPAEALLVFGQDGGHAEVRRDVARIEAACRAAGAVAVETAFEPAAVQRALEARRATLLALGALAPVTVLEDVTVPRARTIAMVERIQAIAAAHDVQIATFGHAGEGTLHPTCLLDPDDGDQAARMRAAFATILEAAVGLGGTITGEHGVGLVKLAHLEHRHGAEHVALLRRIKTAFDPRGILNPGKLGS